MIRSCLSRALLVVLLTSLQASSYAFHVTPSLRASSVARTSQTKFYSTTEKSKGGEEKTDKKDFIVKALEDTDPTSVVPDANSKPAFQVEDYVFVGDHEAMKKDKALHSMSSERHVWRQFRKEQDEDYLPLDIILERSWDTAEDVYMHIKRSGYEDKDNDLAPEEDASRKTIVVLGSGWAAHSLMKVADCRKLKLVIVSPTNHFVFTPMLSSAAVGTVHYQSMTEAVRASNPMIHDYIEGSATGIDVNNKKVKVQLKYKDEGGNPTSLEISYDHLVVAVGSQVFDFNTPGVKDYALKLKSIDDARKIRTALGECFERASAPDVAGNTAEQIHERSRRVTFLIAGGGPTGVELAGELQDLFKDLTRKNKGTYPKLANATRVILVEGGPTLVPPFNDKMRAEALRTLQEQGVEVHLNTFVTKVSENYVKLSAQQFDPKTGEPMKERKDFEIPVGLTLWAAGTKPQPFVETLLEQLPEKAKNRDGRVKVDRWMRPMMHKPELFGSVLVLGDAAAQHTGDTESPLLPPTAQVAAQQGAYIARNLNRNYDLTMQPPQVKQLGKDDNIEEKDVFDDPALAAWLKLRGLDTAPPFHFLNLGILAYLGSGEALSQIHVGDKNVMNKSGTVGYLLFRSVYFVKQVATRNRVLVTFDWLMSHIFGRDTTRF